MELKTNYQYTYFIHPFFIKEENYENYMLKLLKNKNISLKLFEKEKDLDIDTYFLPSIKEYLFPSLLFSKEKKKKLNKMENKLKAMMISKHSCSVFEYNIGQNIQGKMGEEGGIFFKLQKVNIICFQTGICFFVMKTHIEGSQKFSDLLNFNYKFREINTNAFKLKEFENIKLQTDVFENKKEITDFMKEITGEGNEKTFTEQRFFTYSYACVDSEKWNETNSFDAIENEFLKYANILPYKFDCDYEKQTKEKTNIIDKWKYTRYAFTKLGGTLFASDVDIFNYTKLPYIYENQYFYTYILRLYQKLYLKKLIEDLKDEKNIEKVQKQFAEFTKEVWVKEISNDEMCSTIYRKWGETLELESLYQELKNKYDLSYKQKNMEKSLKSDKVILIILTISLIMNVINFIALMKLR